MTGSFGYKEAYLTMMRASEQTVRDLEAMQQRTAEILSRLIGAQQQAEELLISQGDPENDHPES